MCLSIAVNHPDRVLSQGFHQGYQWMVTHNDLGFRCGYVRLPKGHPWHGKDCGKINARCHGGLTFAEPDVPCDAPGEDDAYWIGFDCGHGGDAPDLELVQPEIMKEFTSALYGKYHDGTVKDQEYVEQECKNLCERAAGVAND